MAHAHTNKARSHEENRYRVCLICMEKGDCPITDAVLRRIRAFFIENYTTNDDCLPAAICSNCRSNLLKIESGVKERGILPEVYDFSLVKPAFEINTRSVGYTFCECLICQIARKKGTCIPKRKKGRPTIKSPDSMMSHDTRNSVQVICVQCKSPVGRGITHKCTVSTLRQNIIIIIIKTYILKKTPQ